MYGRGIKVVEEVVYGSRGVGKRVRGVGLSGRGLRVWERS